ncbi:hypothetical protein H6P81_000535 [Aristolochia fimbriata]|uniref:Uncharacterized protein n=1 Tax=Aristolochia fimbriata TaxID=158543 RepID=A0AAV7F7Q2_ARIFI|nr:hypothetical protein H6P81_000535 [Aristolochia fimbriata]
MAVGVGIIYMINSWKFKKWEPWIATEPVESGYFSGREAETLNNMPKPATLKDAKGCNGLRRGSRSFYLDLWVLRTASLLYSLPTVSLAGKGGSYQYERTSIG